MHRRGQMDWQANYQQILNSSFDDKVPPLKLFKRNNCTGALNGDDFKVFRMNFVSMLHRLNSAFSDDEQERQKVIRKAIDIAAETGYKWAGPYAELVALDYWSQFEYPVDVELVAALPVERFEPSVAGKIGQKTVDIDLAVKLQFKTVYMDIKAFIPTHYELAEAIVARVKKEAAATGALVGLDESNGGDYLQSTKHIVKALKSGSVVRALAEAINEKLGAVSYTMEDGSTIKFSIAYPDQKGLVTLTTMSSMDPFEVAKHSRFKFVDIAYAKKLLLNVPSFLFFVSNPWFNPEINDFSDFNRQYYRAVTRRVFVELTRSTQRAQEVFPEFTDASITIGEIAEKVTGIIFLEDKSITVSGGLPYRTYIYLNPNATNSALTENDFRILSTRQSGVCPEVIEDFRNDNY